MKTSSSLLTLALIALSLQQASAQIVTTNLNETFATDGNITNTTQNLPTSAQWYSANNAADANISGNAMTFANITNTAASGALAYFTTAGSYVSLANEGDSITMSFDYQYATYAANTSDGFKFGLYGSGGTRVTVNSNTFNGQSGFSNWSGYFTTYLFGTNYKSAGGGIDGRRPTNQQSIFGGLSIYSLTNINPSNIDNVTNEWRTASMTLTRTNSTIVISSSVAGQAFGATETNATLWTNFDSIAIGSTAIIDSLSIRNVQVSYTIPEPTTVALLGLSGIALVAYRLRRRNR